MTSDRIALPGFGLPMDHGDSKEQFPNAIEDWAAEPATVRERAMIAMMDSITDKPDWNRKIFDEKIVGKWRQEALDSDIDVSDKMLDWIIAELRDKAKSYSEDGVVSTLDLKAIVVKSDTAIAHELTQELRAACKRLEDVPSRFKDYHPGSDGKVLDLVHPSLFPLVYGRSKVLPTGRIHLKDSLDYLGKGETTKLPHDPVIILASVGGAYGPFQWLPCQIDFEEEDAVKISSYINNLHPVEHSNLYNVLEQIIAKSIPLWNRTLSSLREDRDQRIEMERTEYLFPNGEEMPKDEDYSSDDPDKYDKERDWLRSNRVLVYPEPGDYQGVKEPSSVDLRSQFREEGIQVIVKLANIELTPEKPNYDGGSWHIEGQLNERICASALYYYDSENITESFLAFRQKVTGEDGDFLMKAYDQDDYEGMEQIYGIEQEGPRVQEIGRILTRQNRLLAFPNVLQHRVSPFRLSDPSKPGHRKLLALFLVDPHTPIISTANVPPQQKKWYVKQIEKERSLEMLPQELADKVVAEVSEGMMTMEEAKVIREQLMERRKAFGEKVENWIREDAFSFCEH